MGSRSSIRAWWGRVDLEPVAGIGRECTAAGGVTPDSRSTPGARTPDAPAKPTTGSTQSRRTLDGSGSWCCLAACSSARLSSTGRRATTAASCTTSSPGSAPRPACFEANAPGARPNASTTCRSRNQRARRHRASRCMRAGAGGGMDIGSNSTSWMGLGTTRQRIGSAPG